MFNCRAGRSAEYARDRPGSYDIQYVVVAAAGSQRAVEILDPGRLGSPATESVFA